MGGALALRETRESCPLWNRQKAQIRELLVTDSSKTVSMTIIIRFTTWAMNNLFCRCEPLFPNDWPVEMCQRTQGITVHAT